MVFESGRVYCHRGCDWRDIKAALGENWTPPLRPPRSQASSALRWSPTAQAIWIKSHRLTGEDVASRYLLGRAGADYQKARICDGFLRQIGISTQAWWPESRMR